MGCGQDRQEQVGRVSWCALLLLDLKVGFPKVSHAYVYTQCEIGGWERGGGGGGVSLVVEAQVEQLTKGKVLAESAMLPVLHSDRALSPIWLPEGL